MSRELLYIRWYDAKGCHSDWQHLEDLPDQPLREYIIDSVGFVLRETEKTIHLGPHLHVDVDNEKNGQYCGDMQIPKSAIIDIWEIE